MNDMDFYKEMIEEYLKNDKRPAMEEFFTQEDWGNYTRLYDELAKNAGI